MARQKKEKSRQKRHKDKEACERKTAFEIAERKRLIQASKQGGARKSHPADYSPRSNFFTFKVHGGSWATGDANLISDRFILPTGRKGWLGPIVEEISITRLQRVENVRQDAVSSAGKSLAYAGLGAVAFGETGAVVGAVAGGAASQQTRILCRFQFNDGRSFLGEIDREMHNQVLGYLEYPYAGSSKNTGQFFRDSSPDSLFAIILGVVIIALFLSPCILFAWLASNAK